METLWTKVIVAMDMQENLKQRHQLAIPGTKMMDEAA